MGLRLNLVFAAVLIAVYAGLSVHSPTALLDPNASDTRELARLETAFAKNPRHAGTLLKLSDHYLRIEQPQLALGVLRYSHPELLADPALAHRLSAAYEGLGEIADALATADLALERCARYLGSQENVATPVPEFACTESLYAAMDAHRTALQLMLRWGVRDPAQDIRARRAYDVALRRGRFVMQ